MDFTSAEAQLMNAKERLSTHIATAGGDVSAIPWASLAQLLLTLLGGCATPKANPLMSQIVLTRALRKGGYAQPRQIATGAMTALMATSDEELTHLTTLSKTIQTMADDAV